MMEKNLSHLFELPADVKERAKRFAEGGIVRGIQADLTRAGDIGELIRKIMVARGFKEYAVVGISTELLNFGRALHRHLGSDGVEPFWYVASVAIEYYSLGANRDEILELLGTELESIGIDRSLLAGTR